MAKKNKVYGVGINDADYKIIKIEYLGKSQKVLWRCPYYSRWRDMIKRCYSELEQKKYPSYKGCTVCEEWLLFSNFRGWMSSQDWDGKELDKDVLTEGNKIYSPETCIFVEKEVNLFLRSSPASRGNYPLGVHLDSDSGKFVAQCRQVKGKRKYLGLFGTPEEAHSAWMREKFKQARILASRQTDIRVAKALINRYKD